MNPQDNNEAPSKLVINGQEYDPDTAAALIDLGNKTKEAESKYNTSFDKVWPEYGRTSQKARELEQELAEARQQLEGFKIEKKDADTPQDVVKAQEAARKLNIVLKDDLDSGYIKKDDLPNILKRYTQEQSAANQILAEGEKLEKEIDGTDGRPTFNRKAVIAYANAYKKADGTNFNSLHEAYEDMYDAQLKPWRERLIESQRQQSLKTLKGGTRTHTPSDGPMTEEQMKANLKEVLWGASE